MEKKRIFIFLFIDTFKSVITLSNLSIYRPRVFMFTVESSLKIMTYVSDTRISIWKITMGMNKGNFLNWEI